MSDLPAPISILSESQKIWIINELGRTENKLAVQIKFKETWGSPLENSLIDPIIVNNASVINELRVAHRNSVDSHEWGSARKRMEKFKEIAERAEQGLMKGVDKNGNTIIEEDFRLSADMVKACREEQDRERKHNLELAKLWVLMGKQGVIANTSGAQATEDAPTEEEGAVDVDISTDTDQYFD